LVSLVRRKATENQASGRDLTESERRLLPPGFDAVGEALASGGSPVAACAEIGRAMARDGVSLGEALSGLSSTYAAMGVEHPQFDAVEALSVAWSEATLDFLHEVTCEDPLTGLASIPHLGTRLDEVYREAGRNGSAVRQTHGLLVVDMSATPVHVGPDAAFSRALRLAGVAELLRSAFPGEETIARAGSDRVIALVRRSPALGLAVSLTREMLEDLDPAVDARVWVEGLPGRVDRAAPLLRDLCA
jgi:hypothetical protein